jgi:HEAT repeat protein
MNITPENVQNLLNSPDFGDRLKGINALRKLPAPQAFIMIQPLVTDQNSRIRYAATSQLSTLGQENLDVALELLRDRLLNDEEIDVKSAAADALGGLKLTAAFEDLQQIYHQTDQWLLQFSIVAALGELGDRRGFTLLQEALKSDNPLLQITAISSLGELGDPQAIPFLLPFADHEDWQVRHRLAQALQRFNTPDVQATLGKLAQDPIEAVAHAVISVNGN